MAILDPQSFNALAVIKAALGDLGVVALEDGETPSQPEAIDALNRLNAMINGWSISSRLVPFVDREVFDITANDGTYTIGPGGDFNTVRPTTITGAALLLNSSSPPIEIPSAILTNDAYEAIQIKGLTNSQWTCLWYNPTYASGFGQIVLWPVPDTADNDLVLYRGDQIQGFTNLTTARAYPPGYFEAMEYNLAVRLSIPYGRPVTPDIRQMATESLALVKRQNYKLSDLMLDPALTNTPRTGYNILTGQGG